MHDIIVISAFQVSKAQSILIGFEEDMKSDDLSKTTHSLPIIELALTVCSRQLDTTLENDEYESPAALFEEWICLQRVSFLHLTTGKFNKSIFPARKITKKGEASYLSKKGEI